VPEVIPRLADLRGLDLTGVPIPDAALVDLRQARPALEVRTSRVNLGWRPGVAGVLRAARRRAPRRAGHPAHGAMGDRVRDVRARLGRSR
jgi:hypothetical protein